MEILNFDVPALFPLKPRTERVTLETKSIYVLSDSLNANEGKYKIGTHSGIIDDLVNRYVTYLPKLIIYFYIRTPLALKIENHFKEQFKSNRIVNIHGNESEWYRMSLEEITKVINCILNTNLYSDGKSIYSKKRLNTNNKATNRNTIRINFIKPTNPETITMDSITPKIDNET